MKKIILILLMFILMPVSAFAGEGLFKIAPEVGFLYHNITSEYGGTSGTGWALSWGVEGGYGLTEQLDVILRVNYASRDSVKYKNAKILNDTGTLEESFRDILLGLGVKYNFDAGSEWVPYIGGGLLYRFNESFLIGLDPKFAYVFGSNRFYSFTIPVMFTYTF